MHKIFMNFEIQTVDLIPARRPDLEMIHKKKKKKGENLPYCRLCHPSGPQSENQRKQKDKYSGFSRELRKLWNMKVTVVPVVNGALGTITKVLERLLELLEIKGRIKTIHATALLRSARIPRRVLET